MRRCDAYVIAPASANTIAKLAAGLADNLLTSAALACTSPLVVAPAMNNAMYEHAATRANLETLRERGVVIVDPGTGALASKGEWGVGRLAEPAEILAAVEAALEPREDYAPRSLDGLRVLVTAGGTREPIDSVRYVGNRSSGRMGFAVAEEAAARGADVTVIAANVSLPRADGVRYEDVETAAELEAGGAAALPRRRRARDGGGGGRLPARRGRGREAVEGRAATRSSCGSSRPRTCWPRCRRSARPGQTLVGFAAEHGEGGVERARAKLERKGLDAVVVNDISRADIGFDAGENEVTIVTAAGEQQLREGAEERDRACDRGLCVGRDAA